MHTRFPSRPSRAFTLIELLTVIAIIGILAGILIPVATSVRESAKRAKTKATYSQWISACVLFKQEYGYLPRINRNTFTSPRENKIDPEAFAISLTGRKLNGEALPPAATSNELFGNKKRLSFYAISEADLDINRTTLIDGFENGDIAVIYDRNGDGVITLSDLDGGGSIPGVRADGSSEDLTPETGITATEGPRVPVLFYSAGKGTLAKDIIYSWK